MKNYLTFLCIVFFALISQMAMAQKKIVTGRILDSAGNPLSNATIQDRKSKSATTSDANGRFRLSVNPNSSVTVSSVGYTNEEFPLNDLSDIVIRLKATSASLDEVVVTALGVRRDKRNLTYSTQQVKGEDIIKSKEANLVNAIAGKVAGVQITSSSGTPGSSSRIVIRGVTSLYGENQALMVVDGVPINNDETGNIYSGPGTNRVADIDPSIVENINVLKGAAATALYGSAGARGVVIITTKNGNYNKKPSLVFSTDLSFDNALIPETQHKYAQGSRGIYANGEDQKTSLSWGPLMDTLKVNGVAVEKHDPAREFLKTGVTTNNTISVSGGGNASSYFMSYSYFDQKGTVPQTEFRRNSIFTKYTTKILSNLTSTFQFNYTNSYNNRYPEGYVLESPLWTVFAGPISYNFKPYLNPDGTQRLYRFSRNNPYWILDNIYNHSNVNRFIPVVTFNYNPLPWLTVTERLGADMYNEQDKYKEAVGSIAHITGQIIDRNSNFRQVNHDFIIDARKQFGNINADVLIGNNIISKYYQTMGANGVGLSVDGFDNVSNASTQTYTENHSLTRKVGFYAQGTFDYKQMLILSLTGRVDGSSVLSTDKRFYPYGSGALGFVFSELMSKELQSKINYAKLRVSYATVGNDNVGPYSLTTPFYPVSANNNNGSIGTISFPYNGQNGFLLNRTLGNPNLRNERLNEYEIGLETKMFHNRVGVEVSYFNKKTTDGIIPGVAIAPSTGYTGTTVNTAKLENKGYEVLLTVTPVRTSKFSWDITANFSQIRNKVTSIYKDLQQLGNGFTQIIVGQPYGIKFGSRFKRAADGQLMIDESGLPYADENQGIIGNITPDWLAGINNTFRYKSLSLGFFFDMKKGGDIENNVDGYGYFYGTPKATEDRGNRIVKGISVVDNKPNQVEVSGQDYYQRLNTITEAVIQDGTYIKLRNVNISYDLNPALIAKTPFKSAALTLTGRNLWIYSPHFTGADPEVSSFGSSNGSQGIYSFSTPTSRSFTVSLRVGF